MTAAAFAQSVPPAAVATPAQTAPAAQSAPGTQAAPTAPEPQSAAQTGESAPVAQTAPPAIGAQTPPAAQAAQSAPSAQAAPAAPKAEEPAANPAPAGEDWLTGSVDVGYRWLTGIGGNFAEYRSVVDLGAGPRLFGLDFTVTDPKKRLFDRLDVRAYGWGGEPYTTAHLDARKQGIYDFTFDYLNIAYFNAIPSYANPLAPAGFDDQAFNERRRNYSLSLDLFPGKRIIPYLVFERNSGYGNGVEMWVQGGNDEFPVSELFRDSTLNYRGGVRFEFNHFHVTVEQGGTQFKDDDQGYYSGVNNGDVTTPLLGESLVLNGLVQAYGIRGHGPYTKVLLTAAPTPWLNVYGQFLYSEPQSAVHFNELAVGNFLMESSLLFYGGQQTLGVGAAVQPQVTGTGGMEFRPLKRLRVMETVTVDRSHDAVSPLIGLNVLTGGTPVLSLTPSTVSSATSVTSLNYSQVVNYTQQQTDLMYDLTNKITLRAGYRLLDGDAIVLPGQLSQPQSLLSGALRRNVALAGATYRASSKLSVNLDYEGASSDRIYFRTDLNNYSKARARARYTLSAALTLQANFQVLNNQNPAAQIQYSFQSRDNSLAIFWTPKSGKRITFMGEYDRSTLSSSIDYLLPPTFAPSVSLYRDNAHTATSAIDVALPGVPGAKLEFGGSLFISSGSRASQYYQPLVRLSVPVVKHLQWNAEWKWYGYEEQFYLYEGFRVHMLSTGLRYSR
ncbi:MAG TPA: hypothetical protein VME43_24555 [Bryobacteraceae bacterium]|nr:hypothetical protein [Bryobacteraceae bacterium]